MTYKNKICPVCDKPFKNHHVTLHSKNAWAKCIAEAMEMEFDELQTITEKRQERV